MTARCAGAHASARSSSVLLPDRTLPRLTGEPQDTVVRGGGRCNSISPVRNKSAYRSSPPSRPLLFCPASQCGTSACCCNAGSAAVPRSNMGCQSFFGSGTWAGAEPAVTNTREVRCDTVLMGGRRVTQPHRVTSLFVTATAHFRRGRSSHWLGRLGPPDPTPFAGVRGEMVVDNVPGTTQQA